MSERRYKPIPPMTMAALIYVITHLDVGEVDECWAWLGPTDQKGYGLYHLSGGQFYLHRVICEWTRGPLGQNTVDHICGSKGCGNPWHLDPVSLAENGRRGYLRAKPALTRMRQEVEARTGTRPTRIRRSRRARPVPHDGLAERLLAEANARDCGCITAPTNRMIGGITYHQRAVVYEQMVGPITIDDAFGALCGSPGCLLPAHLVKGSSWELTRLTPQHRALLMSEPCICTGN